MPDDSDDSELGRALVAALDHLPPRDVVGGGGLLEYLRAANARQPMTVSLPGEVALDVDGLPTAVGPSTTTTWMPARVTITQRQADELGVTPEEFPHIRVV